MRRDRESPEKEAILMVDDDNDNESDDDVDDDDDDEKRSISSESTSCGEFKKETLRLQKNLAQQSSDYEIWRLFQVDNQNMKDIPNADAIIEILNLNGNYCNHLFPTCVAN